MLKQEPHDVPYRFARKSLVGAPLFLLFSFRLPGDPFRRVDVGIHVRSGLETRRRIVRWFGRVAEPACRIEFGTPDEGRIDVDEILDAQAAVDEVLDLLDTEAVHVSPDAIAMVGHLVDHVARRLREPCVALEEVAVAVDMCHHQLVVGEGVVVEQIGVARVVVDDEFIDLLKAVGVALGEPFVFHSEPPVRIAHREASVGGDGVELIGIDHFEDGGEEVEPVVARIALDFVLSVDQFGRQRSVDRCGCHERQSLTS